MPYGGLDFHVFPTVTNSTLRNDATARDHDVVTPAGVVLASQHFTSHQHIIESVAQHKSETSCGSGSVDTLDISFLPSKHSTFLKHATLLWQLVLSTSFPDFLSRLPSARFFQAAIRRLTRTHAYHDSKLAYARRQLISNDSSTTAGP